MSHHKHRLSEAIESAVKKTLNSATEATNPPPRRVLVQPVYRRG